MKRLLDIEIATPELSQIRRFVFNYRVLGALLLTVNLLGLSGVFVHKTINFRESKVLLETGRNTTVPASNNQTFLSYMDQFPVDAALADIETAQSNVDVYSMKLFNHLLPYLLKEPTVGINSSCAAPPLKEPDCDTFSNTLFDGKRETKAKIGVAFKFGFEADVLEIAFHQYFGLVDKIFLFEATRTHLHRNKKPLIWERLRLQPRFQKFQSMVVHLIVDDAPHSESDISNIWTFEKYQDSQFWKKMEEWNSGTKYFSDDDVVMVGDLDEVPGLQVINNMKNCKLKSTVGAVNTGIWFPFGNIKNAFQTDWPAMDAKSGQILPYSLNAPCWWTWKSAAAQVAKNEDKGLPRMIGHLIPALLGGMHMTQYAYVPYFITKLMSISEGGSFKEMLQLTKQAIATNNITLLEVDLSSPFKSFGDRIIRVKDLPYEEREVVEIPWFLACNLQRFPNWVGMPDLRLQ